MVNDQLQGAGVATAQLDAELTLRHLLQQTRTWLHAHNDEPLTPEVVALGHAMLERRLKGEPMAYLLGVKEFYDREFIVTPDVLVPRPETESLVEVIKKYSPSGRLLDVGTGSGCLGLTLALETSCEVTLSDVSKPALVVARKNAKKLGVTPVRYLTSDLLAHWLNHQKPKPFDIITANLPYVDRAWTDTSRELAHEPAIALYAADNGLALIKRLIGQAPKLLTPSGYLVLEADPTQHAAIIRHAQQFSHVETLDYAVLLQNNG